MEKGISLIIPTYNGGQIFLKCLEMIGHQDYAGQLQLIIVDSGSIDGTVESAKRAGALVKRIDKKQFHHATTRNEAVFWADFDTILFTVQDAVPCSNDWLADLEKSLCETGAAAVYTDQIPHDDATAYARLETESISRARGRKKKIQQIESLDAFNEMSYDAAYRAIGLDNVCAMYRKELLVNIPFPNVDFAEDMAWAFKIMLLGHKILYNPDIKVKHSHNRSPEYAFNRQVINSFWCAKIMNRVKDDISFLTVRDLMALTGVLGRFANQLDADSLGEKERLDIQHNTSSRFFSAIQKKFSLINRVKFFLIDHFIKNSKALSPELRTIEQQAEEEIRNVLKLIEEEYRVTAAEEWMGVLDQSAANILGRIYGEAYAGSMLRGKISSQLAAFMAPYMRGV